MLVLPQKLKIDAGDSLWRKFWLKMSVQGFSVENYSELYFAARVLHECGFHIIDQFQLKRILKCYHLYLVPHIPQGVDDESLIALHDENLKELLLLKKALWGWVGYFESAFHRLQQIIQERDVKGLQAYLQSYARTRLSWRDRDEMDTLSLKEEKKEKNDDNENNADEDQENHDSNDSNDVESSVDSEAQSKIVGNYISILKVIDADQLGYLPWCLSTDYENILHQCLHQQFIEGIYIMCTSSTLNHCEQFNQRDRWGNGPIHVAAQHLQVIGLKYLLQVPAVDVNLPDRQGKRVLQILLLRLQMRWNSYRRRFSIQTINSTLTNGGGMKAIQQRVGLMDPSPDETLELIKIVLERCDSIADTLLHKDRNGLTALDYCLGLQDSSLILYLLCIVEKNSPSCFLESDTRIKLFLHLLHSAVIMDNFDLVHVIGTKFLSINTTVLRMHKQSEERGEKVRSSSKRVKGTRSYSHSEHMRSPQRKSRDKNSENKEGGQQDVYLGARASQLSDIIALCVTQGKYTALQSLLSLLPSSLTNNNSTTQQKLSLNSSFSYGASQGEDAMHSSSPAFVTSVNIIGTSGLLPLEVAIRVLDEKSMEDTCTKVSRVDDNSSNSNNHNSTTSVFFGLMGRSNTMDLQYLRSLIRAGADPLIYIDISLCSSASSGAQEGGKFTRYHWHMNPKTYNRYDNLFALAAENGNIDVLRLLLLNLDEKRIYPMLNQYSFPVDESLEASLDSGKHGNGPWNSKESLQEYRRNQYASTAFFIGGQAFVSNPLVYAILAGNTTCLEYLLVHTPFKLLVNVRNGVEIKAHYSKLRSELDYDLVFGRVGGGGGGLLTPLAAAAMMGDMYSIKVLLDHGARITDKILLHSTNLLFPNPTSDVAFETYQSRLVMQQVAAVRTALTETSRADPFYEQLPEDFKAKQQASLDTLSSVQIDVSKGIMTVTPTTTPMKPSDTGRGNDDSDSDDTEEAGDVLPHNASKGTIGLNMDEIAAHEKEIQRRLEKKEARRAKERAARSSSKIILLEDNDGSDPSLDSDSGDSALELELAIEEQRRITTAALSALLEVSFITRHKAYTISVRLGEVEPLDKYAMVEAGANEKLKVALKMPAPVFTSGRGNKEKERERRGPEKQTIKYIMQIVLDVCRSSKMGIAKAMSRINVLWEGLFRNPSIFSSMARLTTLLTVHVHNALIRKTRALPDMHHQVTNIINFSLKTVQQHAKRGLEFMKDGKVKSQWLRYVDNSRVHKLLLIINDWLNFVEKCCAVLQEDVTDHSVLITALGAFEGADKSFGVDIDELDETAIEYIQKLKEVAEPYLHLYDQCIAYNNSLRLLLHRPFYSYAYHYMIRPSTAIEPSTDLRPQSVDHPLSRGISRNSGDIETSRSTGIYQLMQLRTSKPGASSPSLFAPVSNNHHHWLASSSWDALLPWWYDVVINSELLHRQRAYRRAFHSGSLQDLGTSISGQSRAGANMDNTQASDRLGRLPLADMADEFGSLSDSGRLYVGVMKKAGGEGWLTPVISSSSTVPFPSLSGARETHTPASLPGICDNDGCDWSMVRALSPLIMAHDEHPAHFLDLCTANGGSPAQMTYTSMVREGFALERNINAVFHCVRSLDAKSLMALLLSNVMASFEEFTDLRPLNSKRAKSKQMAGSEASEDEEEDADDNDGMDRKERKKKNKKMRRRVLHRALQAGDDEKCVSFWGRLRRELSRAASTHLHNQTNGNVSDDIALIAGIIEVARATDLDRLYGEGSTSVSSYEWRRLYLPRIDRTYIEVKGRKLRRNQQYSYLYDVAGRRAYTFASTVIVRRKVVEIETSSGDNREGEGSASKDVFEVVGVHGLALPGSLLSHFDRQLPTHYSTATSMDTSHLDRNPVLSNFLCLPRVTSDLELVFKGDLLINLATRASPRIASLLPEVLGPTVLGWGSVHLVGGIRNLFSGNDTDNTSATESVCSLVGSVGNTSNLSALLADREKDPYCISRNKSMDRYSALSSGGMSDHHNNNSISGKRERIIRTRDESAAISLTVPTSRGLQFRPLAYVRLLESGSENRVRKALRRAQVLRSVAHIAANPDKTGSSYTNTTNGSTYNGDSHSSNANTTSSSILQQFCEIPTYVDEVLCLMDATHALLELSRPIDALMQQLHDNGSIKENRDPNGPADPAPVSVPSLLYVLLRSCLVKDEQTLLAFYRHLSKRPVDVMHKVVGQLAKNFHKYETEILAQSRSFGEKEKARDAPFLDLSTNDQIEAECEKLRSSLYFRHPGTSADSAGESPDLPTYSNDVNLWINWFRALRPFCGSSGQSFVGWVDLLEDTLLHHVSTDLQNWLYTGKNLHERYNVQQGEEVVLDQPHVFQQAGTTPVTDRNFLTKHKQTDKNDRDVSNEVLMDRELAVSSNLIGHTEYLNQAQPILIELFAALQEKKEIDAIVSIVTSNVEAILNYRQVRARSQFGGSLDADDEVSDPENVWLPVSVLPLICFSSSQLGLAIHHPVSSLYSAIGSTLKTLFGSDTITNLSVQASKREVSLVAALVALYINKEKSHNSRSNHSTMSTGSQLGVQIDARQQRLANSVLEQLTLMVDEEILPYLSGHNYDKLYRRGQGNSAVTMWLLQQQYHLRRLSYHLYTSLMALHNNSTSTNPNLSLPMYRALAHKHPVIDMEGAVLLLSAIRSLKYSTVQCVLRSISGGKLAFPPNATFPLLLNTAAAAGQRSVFFSLLETLLPQKQDAGGGQAPYSSGAVRDILSEDLTSHTSASPSTGTPSSTWNCLVSALCGSTDHSTASECWVPPDIWTLGYFEVPYKEDMYSLPEDMQGANFASSGNRARSNNNGNGPSEGDDLDASMVDDYAFRNSDDRTMGILRNQGMQERQHIVEFLLNPNHVHVHSMVVAVEPRNYPSQSLLSALDLAAIYGYWDSIEKLLVGYYGATASTTASGDVGDGVTLDSTTPTKADSPEYVETSPKVSRTVPVNILDELHLSAPASVPCFLWIHAAVLRRRSAVLQAVRIYTNEKDALAAGGPVGHLQGTSIASPGVKEDVPGTIPDTPESYQPPTLLLTDEGDISSTDRFAGYGSLMFVQKLLLSVRTFALEVYTGVYSHTLHDDHSTSTRSGRGVYFRPERQLSKEVSETLRQLPLVDLHPSTAGREAPHTSGGVNGGKRAGDGNEEDAEAVQDTMTAPRSLFEYISPAPAEAGGNTHCSMPEDSFSRTASSYGMTDTVAANQPPKPLMHYSHSLLHDAIATGDEANALEVLQLTMHVSSCISSKTDFNTYFGSASDGEDLSSWRYRYYTIGLLHYAVYFDCPAVLAHLLDAAVTENSNTSDFNRPTYIDRGRWKLDVNAKVALPFPGIEGYLWTPLQLAAHCGKSKCIALLLAHTDWPLQVDISSPTVANTHPPRLASDFGHTHTINPVYSVGCQWMDLGIALSLAVRSHADSSAHYLLSKLVEMMREYRSHVYALEGQNDHHNTSGGDDFHDNNSNVGDELQTPVKAERSQDYISPASSTNTSVYTPTTPSGRHTVVLDLCPNIFPSLFGQRDASDSYSNNDKNLSMSSEAKNVDSGQYNHIADGINLESLVLPRMPEMNFTHLLTVLVNRNMVQTLVAVFAWEDEIMKDSKGRRTDEVSGGTDNKDKETLFHLLVRDAGSLGYSEMVLVLLERCFHTYNFFPEGASVHTFTPVRTLVVLLESGYADRLKFEQQEVEEEDDWDDGRDRAPLSNKGKEPTFTLSEDGLMTQQTLHHLINGAERVSDLRSHLSSLKSMCTAKHFVTLGDIESRALNMSQDNKGNNKGYASINSRINNLKRQVQRIGDSNDTDDGSMKVESDKVISEDEEAYNELRRQAIEAKKRMPLIMKVNNRTIILKKPEKREKESEKESDR